MVLGTILIYIIITLITFSSMIFIHELAHAYIISRYVKDKVPFNINKKGIEVGTDEQIKGLTNRQYHIVLIGGVLIGFLPYFFIYTVLPTYFNIVLILGYLWASKSDLIQMAKNF